MNPRATDIDHNWWPNMDHIINEIALDYDKHWKELYCSEKFPVWNHRLSKYELIQSARA